MNNLMTILVAAIVVLTTVSGCSSEWESSDNVATSEGAKRNQALSAGNDATLNGDEVFILVYREKGFIGSATAWPLQYNGKDAGALKNGSFIAIKTNAGLKTLTPVSHLGLYSEGVEPHQFNAVAGQTYYFRHGTDSITSAKVKLYNEPASEGASKLSDFGLANLVNDYTSTTQMVVSQVQEVTGRAFVERGIKTYPAAPGFPLQIGDKVNVEEGSQAVILLAGSGTITITEKTSFQIPETERQSAPPGMFDNVWEKVKVLLKGERFEIETPTAVAGPRG